MIELKTPPVGDASTLSQDFKSLQLLLLGTMPKHLFDNCCLLIHGNSIGFRCEPVDTAVTGVQPHLAEKRMKEKTEKTSTGVHLLGLDAGKDS